MVELKKIGEETEDAGEQLQNTGIKALDRVTRSTKTRIVYDRAHKFLGLKNDKKR